MQVHLISEHVWSEDYLVRSFYLKNIETGETRTVSQFHFTTWKSEDIPRCKPLLEFRRWAQRIRVLCLVTRAGGRLSEPSPEAG